MAILAVFDVSTTGEQYDQILKDLESAGQGAPDGRLYHVSAQRPAGTLVFDVWESEDKLGRFADVLMPIIARTGVTPPAPAIHPVRTIIKG